MKSSRTVSVSPSRIPARLVASLALALVAAGAARAQSYTSTSSTLAWNASRWNNSANGPTYTAAFTANNAVYFTSGNYSFAGMGAATNVGNVTVSNNVSVNFAGIGSSFGTNGAVRTISLGSGSTFDFNGQAISTTAGTGFIISGSGVFGTGTYSSTTNAQSFTISSGTVIARGTTGLGNGSASVLNLNGGTLASNGNRAFDNTRFGGGISIGGNVQFGELSTVVSLASSTANLSFANNFSLGNFRRTFTQGNNGTNTFLGIISGTDSADLTFAANANVTGSFVLSGANTYSGNTTISGGTLALASTGTFANSPVITVGSTGSTGTVLDLTAKSAFSFGSAQTVKGIGTINIGASKTVTVAGTLAPGNSIGTNTITGNLALTGTLQSELGTPGATASAGVSDRTAVSGDLNLTGSTLQLVNNSGANSQGSAGAGAYRLATYGGTLTGTFNTITNPLSSTLHEVVSYGSGNVDLALYRQATATAPTSSVNLGNVRVGNDLTGSASITNASSDDGFSEQLKGTVTGSGTGFTGVAGGSSGTVNYSVTTSAAGVQTGTATVVLKSTGVGSYADTTLSTTSVSLSGAAYNPASAAASQTVNIKTRVDVAGTASVSLTNTGAADAPYQETLGTTGFTGITNGFTATGSATGIAGGASSSGTLAVGGTFASSGLYSGSATLGLKTEAVNSSGLGTLAITGQTVNINVTAYDLASPSFTKTSGAGNFSGLTLDFGTVSIGTTYTATLNLANASGDFRDSLGGTFAYTGSGSISSTVVDLSSIAAGSSNSFTVSFTAATAGTYTGTIRFSGLSKQANLADVQLTSQDIAITGTAIPEPSAGAALAGVGMIGVALYRRRPNAAKRAV